VSFNLGCLFWGSVFIARNIPLMTSCAFAMYQQFLWGSNSFWTSNNTRDLAKNLEMNWNRRMALLPLPWEAFRIWGTHCEAGVLSGRYQKSCKGLKKSIPFSYFKSLTNYDHTSTGTSKYVMPYTISLHWDLTNFARTCTASLGRDLTKFVRSCMASLGWDLTKIVRSFTA